MVANMAFCSALGVVSVFSSVGFSLRQLTNASQSPILGPLAKSFLGFDAKRSQNEERGRGLRQGFAVATACYLRRRLKPTLLNGCADGSGIWLFVSFLAMYLTHYTYFGVGYCRQFCSRGDSSGTGVPRLGV
jgi:hypothetical protein